MKIYLIDSFYPVNTRNEKIANSLYTGLPGVSINVVSWNRENREVRKPKYNLQLYWKKSPAGRLLLKLWNLYGYYKFLKKTITDGDFIIASHWDMLVLTAMMKKNKQKIIYDNLDIPTSGNSIVLYTIRTIEKMALKKTDAIIFASRFYKDLYSDFKGSTFILENIPTFTPIKEKIRTTIKNQLTISYIGLVRYFDILKNLVDVTKNKPNIIVKIHGGGQDLNRLKSYCQGISNVHFTGEYTQEELPKLYERTDLVWAAYPNKDYNVKYAISNKFHESLFFKVPGIFSCSTELGKLVSNQRIGFVINPYSLQDISSLFDHLLVNANLINDSIDRLEVFSRNSLTWDQQMSSINKYLLSDNL